MDIVFQQAQFDLTVQLSGRYNRTVSPLNRPIFGFGGVTLGTKPDSFDLNETNFSLELKQKLLTGGSYDLAFDTDRNSVAGTTSFLFNPSYSSNLRFNLTQPLLTEFRTGPQQSTKRSRAKCGGRGTIHTHQPDPVGDHSS